MALTFYKWSRTAASNATADATVNWAEGQAPSTVNDSGRAMMASAAAFRDDISGAITTGGTSAAYTVTSYQVFDTLANMSGQMIAFTPHTTNTATVTLNVDALGAKPLRSSPGVELPAGVLVQGTPYVATYSNGDAAFYLRNFYGNPYALPIGGLMPYSGSTAPNSSFALPYGQAISRTTYSALFAITSTTFGTGDGSTTFNIPDIRGRTIAGVDAMGGVAANRLTATTLNTAALGGVGGAQTHAITLAELPTGIVSSASNNIVVTTQPTDVVRATIASSVVGSGAVTRDVMTGASAVSVTSTGANTISVTSTNTGGNAVAMIQPTIALNYIMRVL